MDSYARNVRMNLTITFTKMNLRLKMDVDKQELADILKGIRKGIHKAYECVAHEDYVTATYNLGMLFSFSDAALTHFDLDDVPVDGEEYQTKKDDG
jgi:hypothetical protein